MIVKNKGLIILCQSERESLWPRNSYKTPREPAPDSIMKKLLERLVKMNHKNLDKLTKILHSWAPQLLSHFGPSDVIMEWNPQYHLIINIKNVGRKLCTVTNSGDVVEGRLKTKMTKKSGALIWETSDKALIIKYYNSNQEIEIIRIDKETKLLDFDAMAAKEFNGNCPLKNFLKQDLFAHYIKYCKSNGIMKTLATLGAKASNAKSANQVKRAMNRSSTRWYKVVVNSGKGLDQKLLNGVDAYKLSTSWGFKGVSMTFRRTLEKGVWEANTANSSIKIEAMAKNFVPKDNGCILYKDQFSGKLVYSLPKAGGGVNTHRNISNTLNSNFNEILLKDNSITAGVNTPLEATPQNTTQQFPENFKKVKTQKRQLKKSDIEYKEN